MRDDREKRWAGDLSSQKGALGPFHCEGRREGFEGGVSGEEDGIQGKEGMSQRWVMDTDCHSPNGYNSHDCMYSSLPSCPPACLPAR